eukprot:1842417-Amphidinium_carterae.1
MSFGSTLLQVRALTLHNLYIDSNPVKGAGKTTSWPPRCKGESRDRHSVVHPWGKALTDLTSLHDRASSQHQA